MTSLNPTAACNYLSVQHDIDRMPSTLAKLRRNGGGPAYFRDGQSPRYLPAALDAWADELRGRSFASTAEERGAQRR